MREKTFLEEIDERIKEAKLEYESTQRRLSELQLLKIIYLKEKEGK